MLLIKENNEQNKSNYIMRNGPGRTVLLGILNIHLINNAQTNDTIVSTTLYYIDSNNLQYTHSLINVITPTQNNVLSFQLIPNTILKRITIK